MKVRNEAFRYYFYFMQERMQMFWNRYSCVNPPYTEDKILSNHRFTNVYRATDRVSQYLISKVIYSNSESYSQEDVAFRIILFKVFNKIETWESLEKEYGPIKVVSFSPNRYASFFDCLIRQKPIFNSAYMMAGSHRKYNHLTSKHEKWLNMIYYELIKEGRLKRLIEAKSLSSVFQILNECSFIGGFLAYQYAIDLNYADIIDFDENSFVKAGIGAIRGIKKCFESLKGYSYEDAIKYTHDHLPEFQSRYGYSNFKNLFGRDPKLIDLQNCFCETDKYLRVKMPELQVDNVRIKQKYSKSKGAVSLFFPPKWSINEKVQKNSCTPSNFQELTLF